MHYVADERGGVGRRSHTPPRGGGGGGRQPQPLAFCRCVRVVYFVKNIVFWGFVLKVCWGVCFCVFVVETIVINVLVFCCCVVDSTVCGLK